MVPTVDDESVLAHDTAASWMRERSSEELRSFIESHYNTSTVDDFDFE